MVSCRQCGSPNNQNNKFCSQCGWAIDPADVQVVSQETAKLVADGQRLFGEGRIQDSLALSETVLLKDPDNVPGLALKGDCLERLGDVEGALNCYEQVVTIKPDSPLDRIRVAQLRRLAAIGPVVDADKSEKRNPIFAGVAALVLLVSAGSALVLANKTDKPNSDTVAYNSPSTESRPFMTPAPVPVQEKNVVKPNAGNSSAAVQPPVNGQPENQGTTEDVQNTAPVNRPTVHRPSDGRGVGISTELPSGFQPVSPRVDIVPEMNQSQPTKTGQDSNGDPDPVPVSPDKDPGRTTANTHQPIIDIKPSPGSNDGGNVGGSKPNTANANEGTALIRVARQYFLAGEYDKAAKAYEKAIKAGVSPASANHRLAQCYVNLNRRTDALNAYQRALAAYQRMVEDGVGDRRLIESYMEECRQAIKLLQ